MAHKGIPQGKARYSLTLTISKVERFRSLCDYIGLPASTLSALCDDAMDGMSGVLQEAKDRGTIGINDIFRLMGKQVELMLEEERKGNAAYKERFPAADREKLA